MAGFSRLFWVLSSGGSLVRNSYACCVGRASGGVFGRGADGGATGDDGRGKWAYVFISGVKRHRNAQGEEATTGRFRYATTDPGTCNDTFGTRVPTSGGTDLGTGSSAVPYSITVSGLTPGTTYYFCAIVSNASGTAFGAVLQFTIPTFPAVVTGTASSITSNSATLQATANPLAATTTGWFRYSPTVITTCDDSFGVRVPSTGGSSLGAGITPMAYQQGISGLLPATTYYYCAIANNSYGNGYGAVQSFTTPAMAPVINTGYASSLTRTTGVLNGSGNPGGAATTGWFRYATASPGTCNDTFGTRTPATGGLSLARARATPTSRRRSPA